ncbi:MAG: NUDIX hydrolase [Cyclobacteriaceae bacterium]|nr:NUDIX hydrolase [Cyclobacteriaceae bacterium]
MSKLLHNYNNAEPQLIAVDCIVFGVEDNQLQLLIFKREVEPLAGEWSLLGSFVKPNEDVSAAAKRVLEELSDLKDIYMEQLHCYGNVDRDSGGRVISIAYWSLIRVNQTHEEFHAENHIAKWVPIDQIPKLVLDHGKMVEDAIEHLRERARFHPVGFELLPEEFTIPQLLKVYEAIFDHKIDDRNFRKKLLKSDLLIQLPKKDKTTSKKGSFLYKFNQETYERLLQSGYNFEF